MNVGVERVTAAFRDAAIGYLALGFGAYAVFFVLRGLRWKLLLRNAAPSATVRTAASLSAFGWLVSTFVPMKAGDVTRATLLARRERASFATVAGTVPLERALDVLGLAATASLGLLAAAVYAHPHLPASVQEAVAVAWALPILGLLLLFGLASLVRRYRDRNRLTRFVARFLDAADELRRSPRRLPALLLTTLLVSAAQVAVFLFLFLAFEPGAPPSVVLAGVPIFLLSFAISIVPGNVGTYEAAFILVFGALGFDEQRLSAVGIALHILTTSMVVVLGAAGLVVDRLTRTAPAPQPVGAGASP